MTDRERELTGLLLECKGFLIGRAYIQPQYKAAYQPIIDKITTALAEPREGSEA